MFKIGDKVKLKSLDGLIIGPGHSLDRVYEITEMCPGDLVVLDRDLLVYESRLKKIFINKVKFDMVH